MRKPNRSLAVGLFLLVIAVGLLLLNFLGTSNKNILPTNKQQLEVIFTDGQSLLIENGQPLFINQDIEVMKQTEDNVFVLTKDGKLYGKGSNQFGQLGIGKIGGESIEQLRLVEFSEDVNVVKIDITHHHVVTLSDKGEVWSWGNNLSGQIGNDSRDHVSSPVKVFDGAKEIAAGYRFSAAIKENGELWAWGMNCDPNQPGLKELISDFANNISVGGSYYGGAEVTNLEECLNEQNLPIASIKPRHLEFKEPFQQVTAGYGHLLMIDDNQKAWGFGCNGWGQLGRGHNQNNNGTRVISAVTFSEDTKIIKMQAGFRHSVALDENGKTWIWGKEGLQELQEYGQNRSDTPRSIEIEVKGDDVAAGYDMSAVLSDRKLYANSMTDVAFKEINDRVDGFSLGRAWQTYWAVKTDD